MRLPPALLGGLLCALGGCYDFSSAYSGYCAQFGCGPDGSAPGRDSGTPDSGGNGPDSGSSGNDAGGRDAGRGDAGHPNCGLWSEGCNTPTRCCNSLPPPDAGAFDGGDPGGPNLGCSSLAVCEFRPQGCLPQGYLCLQNSDCCGGACANGSCSGCGSADSGMACSKATECCVYEGAECSSAGVCVPHNSVDNVGAHCASDDFCTSLYCAKPDGGPDGICASPLAGCTGLGGAPADGGGLCCPGLSISCGGFGFPCIQNQNCCSNSCGGICVSGPGDGGTCCLPDGTACRSGSSCCAGNCIDGVCGNNPPNPAPGLPCVTEEDCYTPGLICDLITGTCQTQFCFPLQATGGWGGCGTVASIGGSVTLTTGSVCQLATKQCSIASECCSDQCLTDPNNPAVTVCTDISF